MAMAKSPPEPLFILRGHEGAITALHFVGSADLSAAIPEHSLISGSNAGEIIIWNLQTFRSYYKLKIHDGKTILWLNYFKKVLYSQGKDGIINFWNFNSKWKIFYSIETHMGFCASSLFLWNDNPHLVSAGKEMSTITTIDCSTGETRHRLQSHASHLGMCMCVKVVPYEGRTYVLVGLENGSIHLWDVDEIKDLCSIQCYDEPVLCLDYDTHSRRMGICGSVGKELQLWTLNNASVLLKGQKVTMTNAGVNSVKIREDGKIALVAGWDGHVRIFSWKTLKPLAVLMFHVDQILSLQCGQESVGQHKSVFATGGKDKNIVLWSLY